MLRIYSILQLQSVWDTLPSQKAPPSVTLSRHSSDLIQPATLLTSAASLVLEDNIFTTSTSTSASSSSSSLPERPSSLPTPSVSLSPSVHANDCQQPVHQDISQSDGPLYHHFEQVHPLNTTTNHETPKKLQSSSDITGAVSLPPPVPMKDPHHHFMIVPNTKSDNNNNLSHALPSATDKAKKKEKRLSKYGFFGSRSAATSPPPPIPTSSMILSPAPSPPPPTANQLIDNANKTLRRETSKFNLRRKSLSKKVKRAISTIKLNGTTDSTHAPPLPPMATN